MVTKPLRKKKKVMREKETRKQRKGWDKIIKVGR